MSIGGSSNLGTLLVQRLDAMLGVTLSQQTNLISGARPDAVSQPGNTERAEPVRNDTTRHPRESVERATQQSGQGARQAADKALLETRNALLLARSLTSTQATASAPTTLGQAARTVLALLSLLPDQSPVVHGRQPLLSSAPGTAPHAGQAGAAAGTTPAGQPPLSANVGNAGPGTTAASQGAAASSAGGPSAQASHQTSGSMAAQSAAPSSGARTAAGPLSNSPAIPQLAQALTQAVQHSGMFYEAHLAQLFTGQRSLADIRQEPQAQFNQSGATASAARAPTGSPTTPDTSSTTLSPRASEAAIQSASATQTGSSTVLPGLDPQSHTLVRQQLEVLAHQAFAWRGEAWPGAPMDWDISRHEARQDEHGNLQEEHWATRIKLSLPKLGEVEARLAIVGQRLTMQLAAPTSAGVLDEHTDSLRTRLRNAGINIERLSIADHEQS